MNLVAGNSWWQRAEAVLAVLFFEWQCLRLRTEHTFSRWRGERTRILATACWSFPIYSQSFVYQELTQLIRAGFTLRFLYSHLDREQPFPDQFRPLWRARRRLTLHDAVCERSVRYFVARDPKRVEALVDVIARAAALSTDEVRRHVHFRQAFAFARLAEAFQPDYLHSYFFYEGSFFTYVTSALLDVRRGVSCYADHMLEDYPLKMVPSHLKQSSIVIATSARIKRELLHLAPASNPDAILVKPNGINVDRFPAVERSGPRADETVRLVSVCRIEPKKGLRYLIEAIALLRSRGVRTELHVIGGIDDTDASRQCHAELRERVVSLGLTECVHFDGRRSEAEINATFGRSDVFVAPFVETATGDKDGIPTAVLEGMAAGLPVVATNAGSILEVITHEHDGLIVPQRDAEALATAIERLIDDPARAAALRVAATRTVREKFNAATGERPFHERIRLLPAERVEQMRPRGLAAPAHNGSAPDGGASGPLVTAVMIFLNEERFLSEAIESVRRQTYRNWELVLVDDGSSDGSTRVAREAAAADPDRIRYVEHEGHRNLGMSASRNAGIALARGAYVAFLDADDVWLPQKLAVQVPILERAPDLTMVVASTQYWHSWTGRPEDAGSDLVPNPGVPTERRYAPRELATRLYPLGSAPAPCICSLLIRTEALRAIGGFEPEFTGYFEDQAFLVKAYLTQSIFVADHWLERYRAHPRSCSAGVVARGDYHQLRQRFLRWLKRYLQAQQETDTQVWNAMDDALRPYDQPVERVRDDKPLRLLRVADGNAARLVSTPDNPDKMRIDITRASTPERYDIQLSQPRLAVAAGTRYAISFLARADGPREIGVGFAKGHSPWTNLGFYDQVSLSESWKTCQYEFVAAEDDTNARLHFDVGGSDVPVELACVTIADLAAGCGVRQSLPSAEWDATASRSAREPEVTPGSVEFGSLRRLTPISRDFGFDRGGPIDRHYIETFLDRHRADIRGRVLEVGERTYTKRFGGDQVTQSDVLHVVEGSPEATIIADLAAADGIPSDAFDCVILTQTLQLIYDVDAAIRTLARILKPGGVVLATFPGITPTYDDEWGGNWYWNFTSVSARRLFGDAFSRENVTVESFGNVLAAIAFLHGIAADELTPTELAYRERGYDVTITVRATKPAAATTTDEKDTARIAMRPQQTPRLASGVILMYHRIGEGYADPWALSVTPDHFEAQLQVLRRLTQPLPLTDFISGHFKPNASRPPVVVTFDDGYADNFHVAQPLLARYDVPATIFVATGYVGGTREFWWDELDALILGSTLLCDPLRLTLGGTTHEWHLGEYTRLPENWSDHRSWRGPLNPPTPRHALYVAIWELIRPLTDTERIAALRALRDQTRDAIDVRVTHRALTVDELRAFGRHELIDIGAHTVVHPLLTSLSAADQRDEIRGSRLALEQLLGGRISSFAYPYGEYAMEAVSAVRDEGFACACSTVADLVGPDTDIFQLPRFEVLDWDGPTFQERLYTWLT